MLKQKNMSYLRWTEELAVGINAFDEEHKILFEMINDFYNNLKNQSNKENISALISEIKDYTENHFKHEETIMLRYHYPDYELHKKEHETLSLKVEELENKLNRGKLILTFEITNSLKDWITNHVDKVDKQYTEFLVEKGIL